MFDLCFANIVDNGMDVIYKAEIIEIIGRDGDGNFFSYILGIAIFMNCMMFTTMYKT